MTDETEQACTDATIDFAPRDGKFVLTFREAPDAPLVTVSCGYGDCEWVLTAIHYALKCQPFERVLSRDAASSEDKRLLFATVGAEDGKVTWEIAAPFGLAGWRFEMEGDELAALEAAVRHAMWQADEEDDDA